MLSVDSLLLKPPEKENNLDKQNNQSTQTNRKIRVLRSYFQRLSHRPWFLFLVFAVGVSVFLIFWFGTLLVEDPGFWFVCFSICPLFALFLLSSFLQPFFVWWVERGHRTYIYIYILCVCVCMKKRTLILSSLLEDLVSKQVVRREYFKS